jgi:hypothetical protein
MAKTAPCFPPSGWCLDAAMNENSAPAFSHSATFTNTYRRTVMVNSMLDRICSQLINFLKRESYGTIENFLEFNMFRSKTN